MQKSVFSLNLFLIFLFSAFTTHVFGQLATYAGSGGGGTSVTGIANETVSTLMVSGFGSNTACSSGGLSGITVNTSWSTYSTAGPRAYIKITPNSGYQLNMTSFSAGMRRSGTGPTCVRFAYSLDNGATWTDDGACHGPINSGCGSTAVSTWSAGALPTGITSTTNGVIIALFPYAPGSSSGTFQINTINIGGTVTPLITCTTPQPITGVGTVCPGTTTTLSDVTTGGTWSSSNANATVSASGVVTGVTSGTSTISYITGATCFATKVVTINAAPAAIAGPTAVCVGSGITLTDASTPGTWSSSNANTAIDVATGVATGVSAGTSVITYIATATGCRTTKAITVNALPAAIAGPANVCIGATVTLSSAPAGGTWSTNNGNSSIGATTGIATGILAGTSVVTYTTSTGCIVSRSLVIDTLPAAIVGPDNVCAGSTIAMTETSTGGTWLSSTPANATIDAFGIIAGMTPGTTMISYTFVTTGCTITQPVTINPLPAAIAGSSTICAGSSVTFTTSTSGGTWASSNTAAATVDLTTGIVTGIAAGSTIISYILPTGCYIVLSATVNSLPGAFYGQDAVCEGSCIYEANDTVGGTWASSDPSIATVSLTDGHICGVAAGTVLITYTLGTGCFTTKVITVNALPAPITGITTYCIGTTNTLSSVSAAGTWSSGNAAVTTITSATGSATGIAAGTATISYIITGCITTADVTVVALPAVIAGTLNVCEGSTTTLADATAGGTWSSGTPANASVDVAGTVTGIVPGTSAITYSLGLPGCVATAIVTVNPLPAAITGGMQVCSGSTTTLSGTGIGTWSSSDPAAAVGVGTGIVTGGSVAVPGTATISYTLAATGCSAAAIVTVDPLPAAITGIASVCAGSTTALSTATTGTTWSSSNPAVAAVGSGTGIVAGVAAGTATITCYTIAGCYRTVVVTVNSLPAAISGPSVVCVGSSIVAGSSPAPGTWSSSATAIATVTAAGLVSGISAGTATITYTITASGCYITKEITVNPIPAAFTGVLTMCPGTTTTLSSSPSGATWSSSNIAIATIDGVTGVATGISPGTSVISYTLATGCSRTAVVTVYPLPSAITGPLTICQATSATLLGTPAGGTWVSNNLSIALINTATGVINGIAAGTTVITYTVGTGCFITTTVTVLPAPVVSGTLSVCAGLTVLLNGLPTTGVWSSSSASVASVSASGVVSGFAPGTANITYMLPTGCRTAVVVTVHPLPAAITGSLSICAGSTTILGNTVTGGIWSSSNTAAGTIDASTGLLGGIAAGTTTITYTLSTGCIKTTIATVNPLPSAIGGIPDVCVGSTTALTGSGIGGTWASSNPAAGTADAISGVVTGIAAGTTIITYTLPTACYSTTLVTVHPLPASISGVQVVCEGATTTLISSPLTGTWSTSGIVASVNAATGVVTGLNSGTAIITYTLPTGCVTTAIVTVNPLPASISGSLNVCAGLTTSLGTATGGGTWSSSNTAVATINSSGTATGILAGTATISYTITATGCVRTAVITVNPLPGPITGSSGFCNLSSTFMGNTTAGGTWSSLDTNVVYIDPVTGEASGRSVDTTTIYYTLPTGCTTSKLISIKLAPYPITGDSMMCQGQTTPLMNIISGGTWTSSNTTVATIGILDGIAAGIALGTASITYVLSTGCFSVYEVTVNQTPAAIAGAPGVCVGSSVTLSNSLTGGTWSSSNTAVATIDPATGVVTGISQGTTTINYESASGCKVSRVFSVDPLPGQISGATTVCEGFATTLSDTSTVGTWSSSAPGIAYVDASGVVTGMAAGATATISYTLGSGCFTTVDVSVNPVPAPISGTFIVCKDDSVSLYETTTGGIWASADPTIASVNSTNGVVTGNSGGNTIISYILPTGCAALASFTVNALPAAIAGDLTVCAGFATNLIEYTSGGTWFADPAAAGVGTINNITGVVTGITPGTVPVTYTLGSGCRVYALVTVIVLPAPVSGPSTVCAGSSISLYNPIPGGVWSSSNPLKATVSATGVVSGIAAGITTITYQLGTGCFNILTVTVNPLPAAIAGNMPVCEGSTLALTSATAGGLWLTDNTPVATVGLTSGIVSGIHSGTAAISYSLLTGCMRSVIVTVNPVPSAIGGSNYICMSSPVTFASATTGGLWSSSNTSIVTIGSASGIASPVTTGTAIITYTLPLTGCQAFRAITVAPLPDVYTVTGGGSYCMGGAGVPVGLSGSQIGVSYVLYYGSSATGYVSGSGLPLSFGSLTSEGTYTVKATSIASGCTRNMAGSAVVHITSLQMPGVTIATGTGDSSCPGAMVTLTPQPVNGGTSPTYQWKVNGVAVSNAGNYAFIPADGDIVTVAMTSNGSCLAVATANAAKTLRVLPSGMPTATVVANPGDTVCQYSLVTFEAQPLFGGTAPVYTWMVNGTATGTGASYSYVPVQGDVVNVKVSSNYLCRLASDGMGNNVTLTVDSLIMPHVSVVAEPALSVAEGERITLHAIATNAGPAPLYQWKVNGYPVAGETHDTYTATHRDYDSITCVVTSSGVCHNISTFDWVFISVSPAGVGSTPTLSNITLFPNPNKGSFSIKGTIGSNAGEHYTTIITDMLGQEVYRNNAITNGSQLSENIQLPAALANGMYILSISTERGETKVFHFIMEQ